MAEIETRFKHVAKSISQDARVRKAMTSGKPHVAQDLIMQHLGQMTLADLVRQCLRGGDPETIEYLLEEETGS